jgi:hypothetical protein
MNKTAKLIIIFLTPLLILIFVFFSISNKTDHSTDFPDKFLTPIFSEEADQSFISSVVASSNLNSGITIYRIKPLESSQINFITFVVFNHTDEPIVFSNQGFGYSLYWYSDVDKTWEELSLPHFPDRTPKILPPNLEDLDRDIRNTWTILENDIKILPYKQVRLYVSGIGQTSNSVYGSYIDPYMNP